MNDDSLTSEGTTGDDVFEFSLLFFFRPVCKRDKRLPTRFEVKGDGALSFLLSESSAGGD